jgi:hypothetical protein
MPPCAPHWSDMLCTARMDRPVGGRPLLGTLCSSASEAAPPDCPCTLARPLRRECGEPLLGLSVSEVYRTDRC